MRMSCNHFSGWKGCRLCHSYDEGGIYSEDEDGRCSGSFVVSQMDLAIAGGLFTFVCAFSLC